MGLDWRRDITGEAWSVVGFVDEILENVLRVFIEPGLRRYVLRRRLQAHSHCCLTWLFCVKNMRNIEVLHGRTRVKKRGPSCEMTSVARRLVVRQS